MSTNVGSIVPRNTRMSEDASDHGVEHDSVLPENDAQSSEVENNKPTTEEQKARIQEA